MLYPSSQIKEHFLNLGIKPGDTIFLHGNAGITSQYIYKKGQNPVRGFFNELKTFLCNGTILVPSFTYSATKGQVFDVLMTPSEVGLFSEEFRMLEGVVRSHHPIFSICAFGKNAEYFTNGCIKDCFGKNTFFDLVYNMNVKIVTLGCPFERVTFIHFVEQQLNISYRYFKTFSAKILIAGIQKSFNVNYFVRNLKIDTELNFTPLEVEALRQNKIEIKPFGRFKTRSISSKDFYDVAYHLLSDNEYALIGGIE